MSSGASRPRREEADTSPGPRREEADTSPGPRREEADTSPRPRREEADTSPRPRREEADTSPGPRREEDFVQIYSADAGETLFAAGSDGAGRAAGAASALEPLAEAVAVMARIRRDGDWESAQTHASLLPYLLEESWELVDAVADGDRDELVSELGDLLLQVLFHSAIGAERTGDAFDVQDVAQALLDKLRRRAPYWFTDTDTDSDTDTDTFSGSGSGSGTDAGVDTDSFSGSDSDTDTGLGAGSVPAEGSRPGAPDAAEQDRLWQEAKAVERREAEDAGRPPRGVMDGISWDQPALALGQKVLGRARAAGVPDDLVPDEMRVVRVDPVGVFHESGSAEVSYRQVVRAFAGRIRSAESALAVPAADATAADWHAAWNA